MKTILFKLTLNGRGVVNYDSSEQMYFTNGHCGTHYKNDNIKLSKKVFKKKTNIGNFDDGDSNKKSVDVDYVLKISSGCLRHAMFANDYDASNPSIFNNDLEAAYFISTIPGLMRGYMYSTYNDQSYIKKSPLTITAAIEKTGAVPYLEVNSVSTKKEKGINSLFYTEDVGDVKYEVEGAIDLKQMQFMSCDEFFGRVNFKSEWLEGEKPLLDTVFKQKYGYVPYKVGYFTSTSSVFGSQIGEYGIKFDKQFIVFLVRETIKRILGIFIKRACAYAATSSLEIKFVNDGIRDTMDSEDGWVKVTADNVDEINFDVDDFYKEIKGEVLNKQCEEKAAKIKQLKESNKKKKEKE